MKFIQPAVWLPFLLCLVLMTAQVPLKGQRVSTPDSLVLVHIYNNLGGSGWDSTWVLMNPISTWQGVTIFNGRVTGIDLKENELPGVVPDTINALTELRVLNLSGRNTSQKITALPVNLSGLSNLDRLLLEFQNLTQLPSLDHFTKLTVLDVEGNDLDSLPDLSKLKKLEQLYVGGNNLTRLPAWDSLKSLRIFYCSGNQLTSLPAITDSVTHITSLVCGDNQIGSFPSFEHMKNLELLYFQGNQIDSLPDLPAPEKLLGIRGQGNGLRHLPDLAEFKNLVELDIPVNDLDTLVHLDSLKNLQILKLNRNPLNFTPPFQHLTKLYFLALGDIGMDTLPSLDDLKLLREFGCSENNLTYIPPLDSNLLLEQIFCNTNALSKFPLIGHLKKLRIFIAYENELYNIPGLDSLSALTHLDIQDNLFSQLPDLSRFPDLFNLSVTGNFLDTLVGLDPFIHQNLKTLLIGYNQIRNVPYIATVSDGRFPGNKLNFDDLLPYTSILPANAPNRYFAQSPISMQRDTIRDSMGLDSLLVLSPFSGGNSNNQYTWFKNNDTIPVPGNTTSFEIDLPFTGAESDIYTCRVENPALPGLTLITEPANPCIARSLCDMNLDGECDLRDLEPLAAQMNATGNARDCGEEATNWGTSYQGHDLKFIDCTGEGTLDKNDTTCIFQFYDVLEVSKFLKSSVGTNLTATLEDSAYDQGSRLISTGHRVRFSDTVENATAVVFVREIIPPPMYVAKDAWHVLDSSDFAIREPNGDVDKNSMLVFTRFFDADTSVRSPRISSPHARIEVGIFRINGNGKTMTPKDRITTCKVLVEEPDGKRDMDSIPIIFVTHVLTYQSDGTLIPMTNTPDTSRVVFPVGEVDPSNSIQSDLASKPSIKLYPNPITKGQLLHIEIENQIRPLQVQLLNLAGNHLWKGNLNPQGAGKYDPIALPAIASGMYLLRIDNGQQSWWEKVLVR